MNLAQYLEEQSVKPSAFADRLGVPASTVQRWLKGERVPRIEFIAAIQRATNGAVQMADFIPTPSTQSEPVEKVA